MSEQKDSPQPLRKSDSDPLFKEGDDGYVVKALSPIERQRKLDGTPHTSNRQSAFRPKDTELYIGEDKISKASLPDAKSVSAQSERDIDPDEVVKAFMASGSND